MVDHTCNHRWVVWPETDGQQQYCAGCNSWRDTPDDKVYTLAPTRGPLVAAFDPHEEPKGAILGTQVGGDHYTRQKIQPIEYIWANNLGFSEGNIIKYATRWRYKGGIKDLKKMVHHGNLLIEEAERAEREDGVKYGLQSDPR